MKQISPSIHLVTVARYVLCLLLFFPLGSFAADKALIALSGSDATYHQIANKIISYAPPIEFKTIHIDELKNSPASALQPYTLIIPIGSAATEFALANASVGSTIICSLIPHSAYQRLQVSYSAQITLQRLNISAVFLDQPYSRQLALARLIKPDFKRLGFILGPSSKQDLNKLKQAAERVQINLNYDTLDVTDNPVRRLQPIIDISDLFIALPDHAVFNRTTAKWLLYMSYQKQIPLIAFSRSYVDAGAIAAVISSPAQIGLHTAEVISEFTESEQLPAPQYSRYFTVLTNPQAAQKLRIALPDPSTLQRNLMEADNR
ncbi:MAG: ABC transporter substrate binding protein [Amphritea sp.]